MIERQRTNHTTSGGLMSSIFQGNAGFGFDPVLSFPQGKLNSTLPFVADVRRLVYPAPSTGCQTVLPLKSLAETLLAWR